MLGGEVVGDAPHLVGVVAGHDPAVVAPRGPGQVVRGHPRQQPVDHVEHRPSQRGGGGDEHGGGVRAVLGLRQQVDGDGERVGGVVGDDQDLGRPGEQVDADLAEQLPLGLGDVGVARPGQHVDRGDRVGAQRHRRDRLDPAQDVDLVGAGQRHRGDRRRRDLAADRGRAGDHVRHARGLRGHDRHVRRRRQRVPPARHVRTRRADRDVPVPEDHTRQGLYLDVVQGLPLDPREVPDLVLHEPDVVDHLLRQRRDQLVDPLGGQALRGAAVEPVRVLPHRRVAARAHVVHDRPHPLGDARVAAARGRPRRTLQFLRHTALSW